MLLELQGRITETGQLEVDLPPNLPAGKVKITIEILPTSTDEKFLALVDRVIETQKPLLDELAKS